MSSAAPDAFPSGPSGLHGARRALIHVVSSGEWGGSERYAFDICSHFLSGGWDVRALTRDTRAVDRPFIEGGIPVSHAPLRPYPDYFSARTMARLFRGIAPGEGIVHVHTYADALTCIIARRLAGRPDIRLVATRHLAERGRDSVLRRIVYHGLDSHLFVSEFSKSKFYERWGAGKPSPLPLCKTDVAYNSLFRREEKPVPEPIKGPVSAAYRGKLKPGKGLETLIDAMALLRSHKIRLRIMGKGHPDYVDGLRRRAQMAGVADQIDWSRDTYFAEDSLAKVHFGVLPSEEPEAFGMANLEFMACGKPQISTFTGAQREVLSAGEDSLEVAPSDPAALADAILSLASDASLRLEMGSKAFERYSGLFSWPHFISRLSSHYIPESSPTDIAN